MPTKVPVPTKTVNLPLEPGGIYIGIVRQVSGNQVFVEVPLIAPGFSFGPCLVVANRAVTTTTTADGYVTSVTVTNSAPLLNDKVVCAFINNERSELVVLGRVL